MTGLLLGLMLGVGLFLVFWSTWVPDADPVAGHRDARLVRRLRDDLAQAGHEGMRPSTVVLAGAGAATVVFLLALAVSRVPAIGLCFAAMAAYAPLALVRMQARRRRTRLRDLWPDIVDNVSSGVRAGLALPEALGWYLRRVLPADRRVLRALGPGLTPERVARLFTPFERLGAERSAVEGTGLGLAISLEDAHLHGGRLEVWGELRVGSAFRLTLPRHAREVLRQSPLPLVPDDAPEPVA